MCPGANRDRSIQSHLLTWIMFETLVQPSLSCLVSNNSLHKLNAPHVYKPVLFDCFAKMHVEPRATAGDICPFNITNSHLIHCWLCFKFIKHLAWFIFRNTYFVCHVPNICFSQSFFNISVKLSSFDSDNTIIFIQGQTRKNEKQQMDLVV